MSYENVDDLIGDLLYLQEGLKPETPKNYEGYLLIRTPNKKYTIKRDTKIGKFKDMLKLNDSRWEDYYYLINIDRIYSIDLIDFTSDPIIDEDWVCKPVDTKEILELLKDIRHTLETQEGLWATDNPLISKKINELSILPVMKRHISQSMVLTHLLSYFRLYYEDEISRINSLIKKLEE